MSVCPKCGAPEDGSHLRCEFCGNPISTENTFNYETFLKQFGDKIIIASKKEDLEDDSDIDDAVSAIIAQLYVPSDKKNLLLLTSYVVGSAQTIGASISYMNVQSQILIAWLGKSIEISTKLKLMSSGDPQIAQAVTLLDGLEKYRGNIQKAESDRWKFLAIVGVIIGVGFLIVKFVSEI